MGFCVYCFKEIKEGTIFCPYCGRKNDNVSIPGYHIQPGTILNARYQVGIALGEGGFGITYFGKDLMIGVNVAIKEYYPNGYVNRSSDQSIEYMSQGPQKIYIEEGMERFLKEARILGKCNDLEGIVKVRDFFKENNTAYIVMEYLEGETLKEKLRKEQVLSVRETYALLLPVMRSLICIHNEGMIHRDISPDNIMITKNGVKLLDFGAARDYSGGDGRSLSIMLKKGYAPEEQYRTKGEQGPWTDVYALCATIYRCITGIVPEDSLDRTRSDTLKWPSSMQIDVNHKVEKVIMCGLSIYREGRYQNVEQLLNALETAFQGDDSSENPEKNKALSIFLSLGAGIIVLGLIIMIIIIIKPDSQDEIKDSFSQKQNSNEEFVKNENKNNDSSPVTSEGSDEDACTSEELENTEEEIDNTYTSQDETIPEDTDVSESITEMVTPEVAIEPFPDVSEEVLMGERGSDYYRNSFFGFGVQFDSDWVFISDDSVKKVFKDAKVPMCASYVDGDYFVYVETIEISQEQASMSEDFFISKLIESFKTEDVDTHKWAISMEYFYFLGKIRMGVKCRGAGTNNILYYIPIRKEKYCAFVIIDKFSTCRIEDSMVLNKFFNISE